MEFDIQRNEPINKDKYSDEEFDLAYEFSKRLKKEFKDFIKCIVLFGSITKKGTDKESDIDILIIIDDVQIELTPQLVESYRVLTEQIIKDVSTKLHITSLKYTTFWEYVRMGDPVGINMLREGLVLVDVGFFVPLQILLRQGRIKPSIESIWMYFSRSPTTMANARWHVMQGALDLYWAVIDAAQAVLMRYNEMPPPPEMVGEVMEKKLIPQKILKKEHAETVKEFYSLSKLILHRDLKELSGKDFDEYYKKAYDFISAVKEILEKDF